MLVGWSKAGSSWSEELFIMLRNNLISVSYKISQAEEHGDQN